MRNYLEGCTLTALLYGHRFLVVTVKSKISYRPTWKHTGVAAAAVYFLWPVVRRALPTLVPVVTVTATVWFVAAMAIAASGAGRKLATDAPGTEHLDGELADEVQDPPAEATLYALIREVAARSDQGTAAHLPDLLDEGQKRGLFGGWGQPI